MIQFVTRVLWVLTCGLGGYVTSKAIDWQTELGLSRSYVIFLFVLLGSSIGFLLGGIVGREIASTWRRIELRISKMSAIDLALATIGITVGLIAGFLLAQPLRLLEPTWLALGASILTYLIASQIGLSIAMSRRKEMALIFPRLAIGAEGLVESHVMLMDTSAVIDGRFVELGQMGLLRRELRVPRFVLAELQTLADSADEVKRQRGRRGLDLLASLPDDQSVTPMEVDFPELPAVDDKLMHLALDMQAALLTVDYNLTKVARVRGISVVNLNELATALRPNVQPGDTLRLRIAKQGKEPGQGIGHLEDGTMVVVRDGHESIGSEIQVNVTSVLQTAAGRMIFAEPGFPLSASIAEEGA